MKDSLVGLILSIFNIIIVAGTYPPTIITIPIMIMLFGFLIFSLLNVVKVFVIFFIGITKEDKL